MEPTNASADGLRQLITDFRNDGIRNRIGPALALLRPGDWEGFLRWASTYGYAFRAEDVRDVLKALPHAVVRLGKNPALKGWVDGSIEDFIAAREKAK